MKEEFAKKLRKIKSNISRLENVHSSISPKLSTIRAYADAVGYKLKIDFVLRRKRQHNQSVQTDQPTAGR